MTQKRTAAFLMANLGSEVSRLLSSKERGDFVLARSSHKRAKKIILDVSRDPEMQARMGEISLLEDVIDDVLRKKPKYEVNGEHLKGYFLPIAQAVARKLSS